MGLPSWELPLPSRRVSLALPSRSVGFGFSFPWLGVGLSFFGWELVLPFLEWGWPSFLEVAPFCPWEWWLARPSHGWVWPFLQMRGSPFLLRAGVGPPLTCPSGLGVGPSFSGCGPCPPFFGGGWPFLFGLGVRHSFLEWRLALLGMGFGPSG